MKELKAPEKIHVQPNAHDRWFEGKIPSGLPNGLFVEYTRTDYFTEKAVGFLLRERWKYDDSKAGNEAFTKAFREYMNKTS